MSREKELEKPTKEPEPPTLHLVDPVDPDDTA